MYTECNNFNYYLRLLSELQQELSQPFHTARTDCLDQSALWKALNVQPFVIFLTDRWLHVTSPHGQHLWHS